jgi:hypothetical protein
VTYDQLVKLEISPISLRGCWTKVFWRWGRLGCDHGVLTEHELFPVAAMTRIGARWLRLDVNGAQVPPARRAPQRQNQNHLYYPSRRQPTPAFAVAVDALRYRG